MRSGKSKPIVNVPLIGGVRAGIKAGYNCTPEHAEGKVTWGEWLERRYRAAVA